jgi:tetratricopeptide (TPR) repeat protein
MVAGMKDTTAMMQKAVDAVRSGHPAKAERSLREILKLDGKNIDALCLLGTVALDMNKADEAASLFERAEKIDPHQADLLLNLGYAYKRMGRFDEAMETYRRSLKINPRDPRLFNNMGGLMCDIGQFGSSIPYFVQAIQLKRDYAEAHYNLGNAFHEQGHFAEALKFYDQALRCKPDYPEAQINRGIALYNLWRRDEAEEVFRHVLELEPENPKALLNLGNVLRFKGRPQEAIEIYDKAIALRPRYTEAFVNRGTALRDLGKLKEAEHSFQKAIEIDPNSAIAFVSLGTMKQDFGKIEESVADYDKALSLAPKSVDAKWNKALALLALGRYDEGWALYECGLGHRAFRGAVPVRGRAWDGREDLAGKTILIWSEQGLGDAMQFVRYADLCKQRGAKVIVQTYPPLLSLFENTSFIDKVVADARDLTFDFQVSMMSLPHLFKTKVETIPADIPYLFASEDYRQKWHSRFDEFKGARVALVWAGAGRPDQVNAALFDKRRSLTLDRLEPLLSTENATFFSLQIGPLSEQTIRYQDRIVDMTADIRDFSDTAAFVENMDLVLSVDTSVVHLAGGMGKPVWVMSRFDACWRWLQNRETSPWYPSARVFGQKKMGEWDDVIERIRTELGAFCAAIRR